MIPGANNNKIINKTGAALIVLVLVGYLGIIMYKRPWVDCDLLEGVFSLNNYLNGLGFHQKFDVGSDYLIHQGLLSYWVPGEYLYPYFISRLLHIDLANGIIISNIIFLTLGLTCYYYLLKHFKFSKTVILGSILLLVCQRFFHGILLKMNAVDVYLIVFAAATTLLYEKYFATQKVSKQILYLCLLLVLFLMGLFTKNSFLLFIISISVFYFIYHGVRFVKKNTVAPKVPLIKFILPSGVALASAVIFYFLFYAQGRTPFDQKFVPASAPLTFLRMLNVLIKPTVETLGSPFSFDALLLRIPSPEHSYCPFTTDFTWQGILISIVVLIPLVYSIYRYYYNHKKDVFPLLTIFTTLVYIMFFAAAIIKQTDVYAEDRLFLPMMLFTLPIYISALFDKQFLKITMGAFVVISLAFSAMAVPNTFKYYNKSQVLHRKDVISGFMVHSETDNFAELTRIGQFIEQKYPTGNVLTTKAKDQFLLVQANVPSITVNVSVRANIDSLADMNRDFFSKHNISKMSVLTNAGEIVKIDSSRLIEQLHSDHYSLYVVRVDKLNK